LEGVIAVPIDYRASADLVHRIRKIVEARVLLIGDDVDIGSPESGIAVWRMGEIGWLAAASAPDRSAIHPDDTAEIIFTSGATADPKRRRDHASQYPGEHRPHRAGGDEVPTVRAAVSSDSVPEPVAAQSHVRAGDGDLHASDAAGDRRLHEGLQPE
jgi:acyl-coenzyme A synthetase/AMP-(fatty) acid ligase